MSYEHIYLRLCFTIKKIIIVLVSCMRGTHCRYLFCLKKLNNVKPT